MMPRIPASVIAIVAEVMSNEETHATMDNCFEHADAPGDPPPGSKLAKAQALLRRVNKDPTCDALKVLGTLIEPYMEREPASTYNPEAAAADRENIRRALERSGLRYVNGGKVVAGTGAPVASLEAALASRDLPAVDEEFARALESVEARPREAVSAAANILEAICKTYIDDEGLDQPRKKDLQSVWSVVRKHLGFDPGSLEDKDLQEILSGLLAVVHGVGAIRTHASSAHGAGRKVYRLAPRHARLAVHSAHTLALFILETWDDRKSRNQ